jgi:hypothetical protein
MRIAWDGLGSGNFTRWIFINQDPAQYTQEQTAWTSFIKLITLFSGINKFPD